MLAGRNSVYDNEFYLSATYPPAFGTTVVSLSASQRASIAMMHVFIQCPRLVCLIRYAIMNPEDKSALASAVSLCESLWQFDLPTQVAGLLQTSITILPEPCDPEMADILPDTLQFESVQSTILCTRFWMLQNILCGMIDTLYRHFPVETTLSLLPMPDVLQKIDVDAALQLAKSLLWAGSISQKLALVPLRLHTPIQVSIGPWHRTIRNAATQSLNADEINSVETTLAVSRAKRIKAWLINHCQRIHKDWGVSEVEEQPLLEALDTMAGEMIPDWLPVRVRFEAEDGEMVMKLDYENRTGSYQERYNLEGNPRKKITSPVSREGRWQRERLGVQELPFRGSSNLLTNGSCDHTNKNSCMAPSSSYKRPVDFIHSTGRNLCSTSGWWPSSPNTSTVLHESTPKDAASSNTQSPDQGIIYENTHIHPYSPSGSWPQTPNTSIN